MDEQTKRTNFKKIAERRTNEILAKIYSFRHFDNSSFYSYTNEELDKIINAIQGAVRTYIEPLRKEDKKDEENRWSFDNTK